MSSRTQTYQWRPDKSPRRSLPFGARLLIALAFLLFVAGGLAFGFIFYSAIGQRMTQPLNPVQASIPVLPENSSPGPAINPAPVTSENSPAPSAPAPKERINILLLGIDQRDAEAGQPTRSDTMILLTIDPVSKTMGLLSIPRDLWVPIPGLAQPMEERINAAHFYGDVYKYPGGGVVLAKRTVQYNLGIPVHYYVRVDFNGFKNIVDALGGVTINVDKAIDDDQYPDGDYGVMTIHIPAGVQHMDGDHALQFVRTRHADSDFGRTRRQLQFLVAMRDQALKLNILPKLPSLISQFRDAVKTDLSASDIISLARLASQIDKDNIMAKGIDESMVTRWITPQGGDVLIPKRDEIKKLVDEMFGTGVPAASSQPAAPAPTPTSTPAPQKSVQAPTPLQQENARIEILNGSNTQGLAGKFQTYLAGLGYNVVSIGDAGRYDYTDPVIVYYADKSYTQSSLVKLFSVRPENVRPAPSTRTDVDIRIILGANSKLP